MKVTTSQITLGSKTYDATQIDYESISSETGTITVGSKTFGSAIKKYGVNTIYNITNTLTHCKTSNEEVKISKALIYFAKITPDEGYTLTGASVTIKMDGTDITSTAYDNGEIKIEDVSGDIIITITAKAT